MRAIRRDRSKIGDIDGAISPAQWVVLEHILVNGPSSASDIASLVSSTANVSMRRLNDMGLVQLEREEKIKTGLPKKIYGLTMGGFCFGFRPIARSATTTYEIIENTIKRWEHLCPDVLGNWDLLVKEWQDIYPPSDDPDKEAYGWQKEQLPYQVPWIGVKPWIFYLVSCCHQTISPGLWWRRTNYSGITAEIFGERFIAGITEYVMQEPIVTDSKDLELGPEFFDMNSMVRVIREIPILWEPLHAELVDLKVWHEKCALRTQQLLEN